MLPSCRSGSAIARAAVKRGLRLSVGSWNTIWMLLRSGSRANAFGMMPPISSPSNTMRPEVWSSSRITIIDVVDFPQPDSPTRPTLSPWPTVKLMPSTARKISASTGGLRENSLPSTAVAPWRGYSLTSFSTRRSGVVDLSPRAGRGGDRILLLRQEIAQRHTEPRRRAHQFLGIGVLGPGEDIGRL